MSDAERAPDEPLVTWTPRDARKRRAAVTLEREDGETVYLYVNTRCGHADCKEVSVDFKLTIPEGSMKIRASREWEPKDD